jgi:hypothetical protein
MTARDDSAAAPFPVYRKRWGLFRNPAVQAEIARLDPVRDCQRIVHLLVCYEFPFDITRCLELALFHTYASTSVSRLLAATGEFRRHGQKRYDDTRILISHFLEDGYDSEFGSRAIERMNLIHSQFTISNDDYLFVLSTFVSYPFNWLRQYGYRPMTAHEELAWFTFFRNIGQRMGIQQIPGNWAKFQEWTDRYEDRYLVYASSNREVGDSTVAIFAGWFPAPLRFVVQPVISALISDKLRQAFGYSAPSPALTRLLYGALRLRSRLKRYLHLERYPRLLSNTRNRTYPGNSYEIDNISPSYWKKQR